jgi:hypothetical protein
MPLRTKTNFALVLRCLLFLFACAVLECIHVVAATVYSVSLLRDELRRETP